jgi:hypothetical protein
VDVFSDWSSDVCSSDLAFERGESVRRRGARLVLPVHRNARRIVAPARAAHLPDVEPRRNVPPVRGVNLGVAVGTHGTEAYIPAAAGGINDGVIVGMPDASPKGSMVAQTHSGCCSIRRPNRMVWTLLLVSSFNRFAG